MKNHNYKQEPNVHFTPDGKWIIFRANFEGESGIYAVEIARHSDKTSVGQKIVPPAYHSHK